MARRGWRKPKAAPDLSDPDGLRAWTLRYLESIRVRNYSPHTVRYREVALEIFIRWCRERDLTRPTQVTRPILQRYQRYLFHYRRKNGKPLAFSTQAGRIISVKMLFKWLTRENVLLSNPASELDVPRTVRSVPQQVLTPEEAEAVLALPDVTDPFGLRNRAILEVLYSTGIRRMEILALKVYDLDQGRGTLFIRGGKGQKDRTVPIGERAIAWCDKYLREVRPELACGRDEGALFLNRFGQPILQNRISQMVRRFVRKADLGKDGSCHLFRHTCATAMLEGGADLRSIQEMLGHARLETTEVYTKVSIQRLKQVHTETHPGANLERAERPELEEALSEELLEELEEELAEEEDLVGEDPEAGED